MEHGAPRKQRSVENAPRNKLKMTNRDVLFCSISTLQRKYQSAFQNCRIRDILTLTAGRQHVLIIPMLSFNCCNEWLDQLPHNKEVLGLHQLFRQNRNHKPTISFLSDVFKEIRLQIDLRSYNRVTDPSKASSNTGRRCSVDFRNVLRNQCEQIWRFLG